MAHLYPSLHEKFRTEGLCPICLIEMAHTPRFSCANSHVICHRCRPYYYSCPQCLQPLSEIPPDSPTPFEPPPPTHFMPHPPHLTQPYPPTAPDFQEFYHHERQHHNWQPPSPPREDQELIECPYTHLGCTAKFVPQLRSLHVSRCQYKHHSEAPDQCEQPQDSEEGISCRYQPLGCIVRAPRSRLHSHEELCMYKDRSCPSDPVGELGEHLEGSCHLETDPNQMVDCRFHFRGCRVRMPLWRKESHEAKCNHQSGDGCEEPPGMTLSWERPMPMPQQMLDPEEQTECRWANFGCRVRPNYERKAAHEEKCNYRMEECSYKHRGCDQLFQPSRRYAHESSCGYA